MKITRFGSYKTVLSKVLCRRLSQSCWSTLKEAKGLLKNKALVISPTDKHAGKAISDMTGRLLFELQMMGVSPVKYTLKESFPNRKGSGEAVEIFKRTGAASIVALGDGAVCDMAKQVCAQLESGSTSYAHVPVMVIPASFSPTAAAASCGVLHDTEDVLVVAPTRPPTIVALDPEIAAASTSFHAQLTPLALVAHLYDLYFARAHLELLQGAGTSSKAVRAVCEEHLLSELCSSFDETLLTAASTTIATAPLLRATAALSTCHADGKVSGVGLASTLALLRCTHTDMQGRLPFSWMLAVTLDSLLSVNIRRKEKGDGDGDDEVATAATLAAQLTCATLGMEMDALATAAAEGRAVLLGSVPGAQEALALSNQDVKSALVALSAAYDSGDVARLNAVDGIASSSLVKDILRGVK